MKAYRNVNDIHNLLRPPVSKESLAYDESKKQDYQQSNRGGKRNGAQADKAIDAPTSQ